MERIQWAATYLMNILIPVGCIARLIPFHDAIIVYFCRAVSGKRGSGCDGGGGSLGLVAFTPSDFVLDANFPNSQPIFIVFFFFSVSICVGWFVRSVVRLFRSDDAKIG